MAAAAAAETRVKTLRRVLPATTALLLEVLMAATREKTAIHLKALPAPIAIVRRNLLLLPEIRTKMTTHLKILLAPAVLLPKSLLVVLTAEILEKIIIPQETKRPVLQTIPEVPQRPALRPALFLLLPAPPAQFQPRKRARLPRRVPPVPPNGHIPVLPLLLVLHLLLSQPAPPVLQLPPAQLLPPARHLQSARPAQFLPRQSVPRFNPAQLQHLNRQSVSISLLDAVIIPFLAICDNGWKYFDATKSCYLLGVKQVNNIDAQSLCRAQGALLTSIHSEAENTFIYRKYFSKNEKELVTEYAKAASAASPFNPWIGAYRTGNTAANFANFDGTPVEYSE